jgi:hypothetical protein
MQRYEKSQSFQYNIAEKELRLSIFRYGVLGSDPIGVMGSFWGFSCKQMAL